MIQASLVTSLVAYLNIKLIVTCLSESDQLANEINLEGPVLRQVIEASNVVSTIADARNHLSLILCPTANVSLLSSEPVAFDKNVYWLFNEEDLLIKSDLPSLPLNFLSNVLVATELPDGDFILHEHYAVKSIRKRAHFGKWIQSNGLLTLGSHLVERRKDLTDVNIVVTVKKLTRMLLIDSETELSGWFGEVITYIQRNLNFRYMHLTLPSTFAIWSCMYMFFMFYSV